MRPTQPIAVVIVVLVALCGLAAHADGQRSLTAPATEEEIAALIRDLGSPSYETRTAAARRLCAIGMPASERLREAAGSDNVETALRAEAVLDILDRLLLAGVDLHLSFSKEKIAWDEPVDLRITMTNRSRYPARVPFTIDLGRRVEAGADARQVGDMLDVAELVTVNRSDGREVELIVDDIAVDPAVVEEVQERLNGGPVGVLAPGQRFSMTAYAFNRGWARYPLLDAGVYTVVMEYMPKWQDDVLAQQRVGRVVSNKATLTVTNTAPETISRDGLEATVTIRRQGPFIIASIVNRTDMPLFVNKNFGGAPPFAEGAWVWEVEGASRKLPVGLRKSRSWRDFEVSLLEQVPAGRSCELARIRETELREAMSNQGAVLDGGHPTVRFTYMNLCDRRWQARQGSALLGNPKAPPVFRTALPRRILCARYTSNRLHPPGED